MILKDLAEIQDFQRTAMAALMVSHPAVAMVTEVEAMVLDLWVLALAAPMVMGQDCLAVVFPVRALAEARPMSVWEGDLLDALD